MSQFFPFSMHKSTGRIVDPLICMRPEEVALSLSQIERQVRGAISVKVREAGGHRRGRDAKRLRRCHRLSPARLGFDHPCFEIGIEQKIRKIRPALICLLDLVEKLRTDYAAALPNTAQLAEVDVPVVLI